MAGKLSNLRLKQHGLAVTYLLLEPFWEFFVVVFIKKTLNVMP